MLDATVLSALVANDETLGVLDDLSMVRGSLEALIARDAAKVRSEAQLTALRDALQLMRDTIGDEPAFNRADVVFHAVVGEMTENRLADNIVKTLFHQAVSSARYSLHSELQLTLDEHENIFGAIEAGDPDAAETAMRTHIIDAWERRRPPSPRHRSS
jgi:DNA-binding FadR family transcriptional regulator